MGHQRLMLQWILKNKFFSLMSQPNVTIPVLSHSAWHGLFRDPGFFHLVALPPSRNSEAFRGILSIQWADKRSNNACNISKEAFVVCLEVIYELCTRVIDQNSVTWLCLIARDAGRGSPVTYPGRRSRFEEHLANLCHNRFLHFILLT